MSINDAKSQVHISGLASVIDCVDYTTLIENRLREEFPYHDQRVYRGMIAKLVNDKAYQLASKDFKYMVHLNLIATAKLIWPESNYVPSTNPTLVYNAVQEYVEKRDDQIRAYGKRNS